MTIFDLDDFRDGNANLELLDRLKLRVPDLKLTLFTIPCPAGSTAEAHAVWLREVRARRPWIEYAVHGWRHTDLECASWTLGQARIYLQRCEKLGIYVKVFRAPYWETSLGLYQAILERDWVIADHPRNAEMRAARPPLRLYDLEQPGPGEVRVHGHIQDTQGNGLAECFEQYAALEPPFRFISEVIA